MEMKTRIYTEGRTALETVIPLATPFVLFIDPASVCNFRCAFCPTGNHELLRGTPRWQGLMDFDLYKKIIDDLSGFDCPLKVLRLYKDGEPLLNKRFPDMVRYAKQRGIARSIDTTTNAALLTPAMIDAVIEAGIDRINISIEGVTPEQYRTFSGVALDYDRFLTTLEYLYQHRGGCKVFMKINGDAVDAESVRVFRETFGKMADGIAVEHIMCCWPHFEMSGVKANTEVGLYGQKLTQVSVCPYIFYSMSVNASGTVSACFVDWAHRLILGDARKQSVPDIWRGKAMREIQLTHLLKGHKGHPVCAGCGQLTHGAPDNVDTHAPMLYQRLKDDRR